jgi:type IV pilus assembly protein PilV
LRQPQQGVLLLEALISILIFSIVLIGLVGIQALSVKDNAQAKYRTDAGFIANQIAGDIGIDAANYATYAGTYDATDNAANPWAVAAVAALPSGRAVVAVDVPTATLTITISWVPSSETAAAIATAGYRHQYVLTTRVNTADI